MAPVKMLEHLEVPPRKHRVNSRHRARKPHNFSNYTRAPRRTESPAVTPEGQKPNWAILPGPLVNLLQENDLVYVPLRPRNLWQAKM